MRSSIWMKIITLSFLLLYTVSLAVGCSTHTQTKPLKITKINATNYPEQISAFFSLGDGYKEIFSLDDYSSIVQVLHDTKEIQNYTLYPQRNQKLSNYTILLIDTSYSMHTNDLLPSVKENLKSFIQSMTINDKVMIVSYNTSIYIHSIDSKGQPTFLQNKYELSKLIDQIQYDTKNTAFYDAIYQTLDLFPTCNQHVPKNIILFTDLAETHASIMNQFTPEQCKNKASTKNVRMYTIAYGEDIEETFQKNIDELSDESYSSLEFLQIRSFFSEIAAKVYQEDLLYGISTAWFFHPQLEKQNLQHVVALLLEYANYCISKDINGLYQYPNLSLLPDSLTSSDDVFLFTESLMYLDEHFQESVSFVDDSFESCLRRFVQKRDHDHNAVFIIDNSCNHIHPQIEKSLEYALYNGISLSFIIVGTISPGPAKYKSIANRTGGFVLQFSIDTPVEDSVSSLVNELQEGYRIECSVPFSSSLFNHHVFSIQNQDIPSLSDTKHYFSGIINTSFQHSPYFRTFILFLLLILFLLFMVFLLLHQAITKKKNPKKLNDDSISTPEKECMLKNIQHENTHIISTNVTEVTRKNIPSSKSWLCVLSGQQKGQSFSIREHPTKIGRQPRCDISLLDESLSQHHATILNPLKNGKRIYYIQDMLSSSGTYVNNEKISKPTSLHDNDIIQCGNTILVFKSIENMRSLNE